MKHFLFVAQQFCAKVMARAALGDGEVHSPWDEELLRNELRAVARMVSGA